MKTKIKDRIVLGDDELITLEGKYPGSERYFCRKHIFYKRPMNNCSTETWTCKEEKKWRCKVTITTNDKGQLTLNLPEDGHRDRNFEHALQIEKMKNELEEEAVKNPDYPQVIYDRIAVR